jgi:hypothetical protein
MKAGSKVIGNNSNTASGGGVYNNGTFTMNGGIISGNSSNQHGGGVHNYGTFTMNGGAISGNTTNQYGGGVWNNDTFTMTGGTISGNTAEYYGGGVNNANGIFTMSGGTISGNTVVYESNSTGGGGVRINGGTFTMIDGTISGNKAHTGSGVSVGSDNNFTGKFVLQGGGIISPDNAVYLEYHNETRYAVISIAGLLSGSGTVARVELLASNFNGWSRIVSLDALGRTVLRRDTGYTGPLQEDRFDFNPWEVDSDGRVGAKAASLGFGETRSGWLNGGEAHFYRFTPVYNRSYTLTITRTGSTELLSPNGYAFFVSAAWEDGGTLVDYVMHWGDTTLTTPSFVATDSRDIIVMVSCNDHHYAGTYTVAYNEE